MGVQLRTAAAATGIALLLASPAYAWDTPAAAPPAAAPTGGLQSAPAPAAPAQGGLSQVAPTPAAPSPAGSLKAEIDAFMSRLSASTGGVVQWDGSDPYRIEHDGDSEVAVIPNARISIHAQQVAQVALDRIEIRRTPDKDDSKLSDLSFVFPKMVTLTAPDGTQVTLALKDGKASAVAENDTGRMRATTLSFASARVEHTATGTWVNLGPLTMSSKLIAGAQGAWTGPVTAELKQVEFFFPQGPFGGALDRLAYDGTSGGPDMAQLMVLRDKLDTIRQDDARAPEDRAMDVLGLFKAMPAVFSQMQGEMTLEGLAVRVATGEPLVSLKKASMGGSLTGLDGDVAALRLTIRHEGLVLASAILDASKVPTRVVVDLGLENVSTAALHNLVDALTKMGPGATDEQKQTATQQMLGSAAMLNPIFRIYDAAVDTKDVGADLTGKTEGSPISPKGYTAAGDLVVKGFDAIPALAGGDVPFISYLPLLKELGEPAQGAGGTPQLKFHLASAPQKWITVNGNDVTPWFMDPPDKPGMPRVLRPEEPPMEGADVKGVQRALVAAKMPVDEDGVYRVGTAVAVARFQRANGLGVTGVVDPATRVKLNVRPEPPVPAPVPQVQPAPHAPAIPPALEDDSEGLRKKHGGSGGLR